VVGFRLVMRVPDYSGGTATVSHRVPKLKLGLILGACYRLVKGVPDQSRRFEHRTKDARGESEHDAISGTKAWLGHRTLQHDDLLAKDDIFREERGALRMVFRISSSLPSEK
jgi:hypothetical protein